jgi:hypothetical protein
MIRKTLLAGVAVGFIATPALAEDAPKAEVQAPVSVDGNFWTRFEMREGYKDLGVSRARWQEGDAAFYRARMGLTGKATKFGGDHSITPRLVLQSSGVWGSNNTITDSAIGMHEGYIRIAAPDHRLDVGRFEMAYGDHLVIGSLGWHQTARAFDGIRMHHGTKDHVWLDAFVTMANPGGAAETHPANDELFEGDSFFAGVYGDVGGYIGEKLTLELYGLLQKQNAVDDAGSAYLTTLGTRFAKSFGKSRVKFEAGVQIGSAKDAGIDDKGAVTDLGLFAYQADLEYGLTINKMFWVGIGGQLATSDDPETTDKSEAWVDLYPTGHKFLGLMDVMGGRSNVASGRVRLRVAPREGTKILLDGHYFTRPEMGKDASGNDLSGSVGSEVNLNVIQKIGGGLAVRGLYGVFLPTDNAVNGQSEIVDSEMAHYVALQLTYGFK